MDSAQFESLTPHDWQLLTDGCYHATHRRGEVILEEGASRRSLFILRAGLVRVERARQGKGIAIDQLGPGEIFGEMSLLENTVASASVIAQEDVEVDIVSDAHLQALLSSEAAFAARFYHSLAINLSRRLRTMTQRIVSTEAQADRLERQRTGNISAQQIPPPLRDAVDAFEATLLRVDQGLRNGALSRPVAQEEVSSACETLVGALNHYTQGDALVEIGWDDLLSFRDTPQLESGVGDYVFRETFGKFMLSATIARCYDRPRGIMDDFEVSEMIFADEPEGDDRLGVHIDRWFLARPFCQARRNRRRLMADLIVSQGRSHVGSGPMRLTALGSGVGHEIFDAYRQHSALALDATCLDIDHAALALARDTADALGSGDRMTFVLGDVVAITAGQEKLALPSQDLIYAVGLCDSLADDVVLRVLNWSYDHLAPQGAMVLGALHPAHPDRALVEHILKWPLVYRTEEDLAALFRHSHYGDRPVALQRDETGTMIIAICARNT